MSRSRATAYLDKIGSLARVRAHTRRFRRDGKKVVFTNGCFDLLHPGHVRYLAAARARGDLLVVGVNSDRSVRGLKGPGRPVQSESARAELLAALECVDQVVIFDAPTPLEVILALEPDVLVKGADWGAGEIVGAPEVRRWGGRVVRVPLVRGESTTQIIARCAAGDGRSTRRASRSAGGSHRLA